MLPYSVHFPVCFYCVELSFFSPPLFHLMLHFFLLFPSHFSSPAYHFIVLLLCTLKFLSLSSLFIPTFKFFLFLLLYPTFLYTSATSLFSHVLVSFFSSLTDIFNYAKLWYVRMYFTTKIANSAMPSNFVSLNHALMYRSIEGWHC